MTTVTEKLQKVLARGGLASRREAERWITAGRVLVNGQIATLGDRVAITDKISVDGKLIKASSILASSQHPVVLLYHKPEGEVCTRHDPEGRPTVFDHLPAPASGRWVMVGRLDYNTSGLLLFTSDGEWANRWMHPKFNHQRVYAVRVFGSVAPAALDALRKGVLLEDGMAHFDTLESMGGEGRNHWYQVCISMGRNRIVRRLWESQGVEVSRLIRLGFGPITLPRTLAAGQSILLSALEVQKLTIPILAKGAES